VAGVRGQAQALRTERERLVEIAAARLSKRA